MIIVSVQFIITMTECSEEPQDPKPPRIQMKDLMDRMDAIERKLDLILVKLDESVIENCDKMGNHIDFVNGVYETVKIPLYYISNKINKIANPLSKNLPLIENTAEK